MEELKNALKGKNPDFYFHKIFQFLCRQFGLVHTLKIEKLFKTYVEEDLFPYNNHGFEDHYNLAVKGVESPVRYWRNQKLTKYYTK
ncbi:hypothetical protein GCQ56_00885 [Marinifilum sp. N1E240]|uniref:hypothetical protein n=1 Tax=Marinifilum sp. N1E240 TaxID=2608082 RepID=UPI00128C7048|nr:hypothetical protein [Marinifilum sp. N1E240]MPQ45547.1 hypothetical protein [Marinifilum sp. N1E240]